MEQHSPQSDLSSRVAWPLRQQVKNTISDRLCFMQQISFVTKFLNLQTGVKKPSGI